jgi:hypothetical protein
MHIKEKFVPHDELLELFGVQRNATLIRMLEKNSIGYILDYKKTPLVLRSSLETANTGQYAEEEATFAPLCEQGEGQGDGTPALSWED